MERLAPKIYPLIMPAYFVFIVTAFGFDQSLEAVHLALLIVQHSYPGKHWVMSILLLSPSRRCGMLGPSGYKRP